jgi:hypothetical protein
MGGDGVRKWLIAAALVAAVLVCGCGHREAALSAAYARLTLPQRLAVEDLMRERHGAWVTGVGPHNRTPELLADLEAAVVQVTAQGAGRYRLAARWARLTPAQQYRAADMMRERLGDYYLAGYVVGLDRWLAALETVVNDAAGGH